MGLGVQLIPIAGLKNYKIPDGIQGLSPKSPLLLSMNTLAIPVAILLHRWHRGWPGPLRIVLMAWCRTGVHIFPARLPRMTVPYFHSCCEQPLTIAAVKKLLRKISYQPSLPFAVSNIQKTKHTAMIIKNPPLNESPWLRSLIGAAAGNTYVRL